MNDAHYSTFKYSSSQLPNAAVSNSARQMSDKLSSRIAADKAAFFASKKESQQIYENIDKGSNSIEYLEKGLNANIRYLSNNINEFLCS